MDRRVRVTSRRLRVGLLVLVSIASAAPVGLAAPNPARTPAMRSPASAPPVDRQTPMTVTVLPRSNTGATRETALVYLDGRIDPDAPRRLSEALDGVEGKIAVWLNSPGGNLFAGMQLGRIIRQRGASTHIVDYRTLRPGTCYSACAMTFLGGVYRFNDKGARYGVHRASLLTGPSGEVDLGAHLSTAIGDYIREMGVDPRLLDLCLKAGRNEMYVLSRQEARDLGVVNDGRKPPDWSLAAFPGGTLLRGRQATADGTGTVFFSCDGTRTLFGATHDSAGDGQPGAAPAGAHLLTIGRHERVPLNPLSVSERDGVVRVTFVLPPNLVRLAMSARLIGYRWKPSSERPPSIDYRVDVDASSAPRVRKFLGECLRGRPG